MNPFQLLWSFDGRIGRTAYAGGLLLNLLLMIIAVAIVQDLNRGWGLASSRLQGYLPPSLAVIVFFIWADLALAAKRFQDLGNNGKFSLLLLVPGVGLIFIVILLVARGQDKDNCYGPAPSTSDLAPARHMSRDHASADMPQRPS
jgi:uncharacterized membrane protein YhaH (DUF805 family)